MNGIGHEQTLEKYLPKEQVFLGNTMWTAQMTRPDHVLLEDDGSCELSNVAPGEPQASQAKQLVEVLDNSSSTLIGWPSTLANSSSVPL